MKTIQLTKGYYALVDDEDYERINKSRWCVAIHPTKNTSRVRAMRKGKYNLTIFMHNEVLNWEPIPGIDVDHIDGNQLNNQKTNLRKVTRRQNNLNSERSKNASHIERHGNKFRVRVQIRGIKMDLGSYKTLEEATAAATKYKDESFDL